MNIIDIIIILFILMGIIIGYKEGLIRSAISLVALIIVFVISYTFKSYIGNFLCKYLPFFDFSGNLKGMVSLNVLIYQLAGFFLIYGVLMGVYTLVVRISGWLQRIVDMLFILKLPSSICGSIIGFIKGYFVTLILLLVLIVPLQNSKSFGKSKLANLMLNRTPIVSEHIKDITKSVSDIYKLVDDVSNNYISINDANLKSIDIMIKAKIVDPHTVEQLVVLDKLNEINGLDNIIEKYK